MTWASPPWFLGLVGVALLAALLWSAALSHRRRLGALFAGGALDGVLPVAVRRRRGLRDGIFLAGLAAAVLALAGPRHGKEVRTVRERGVDIVLAVDLSRSMDARDVEPSRLERARREIRDLVEILGADRVGLVVYAGGAYPRLPLTQDTDALLLMVDEMATDQFQAQGSDLGEALRVAVDMFGEDQRGRAILVLSDGEVHRVGRALEVAERAREAGVRVYGLLIGDRPAPIPTASGAQVLDAGGAVVMTRPSSDILRDLARTTGGAWARSVASDADVRSLYLDEMTRGLKPGEAAAVEREVWRSAHQVPLLVSAVLLVLSAWMGDGVVAGALLAMLLVLAGPARAGTVAGADTLYRQGRYADAARELTELVVDRPADPALLDRLAAARYRAGDFEGAARAWDRALGLRGEVDDAYNAGNAHYRAGRLEEALARYERVLASAPDHASAARNREILLDELEARRAAQRRSRPPPRGHPDGEDAAGGGEAKGNPVESPERGPEAEVDPRDGSVDGAQPGQGGTPTAERSKSEVSEDQAESNDGASGGTSGQERDPDAPSEVVDPSAVGQPGEDDDGAPMPPAGVTIDPAQARRVLEGVEEGRPRVVLPGEWDEHPW